MDGIVDPAFFLHRIDFAADRATFVRADRDALRAASFIDGRTPFWEGPLVELPLSEILRIGLPDALPDRFLFHVGFCGSTLLARLLDRPGRALLLREPQALTDIAAYQSMLDRSGLRDERVRPALRLACRLLQRRWEPHEAVVLKPSNWINNLLPLLCIDPPAIRPCFLSIDRRVFLRAVFRGGADRLAFTARAATHFSNAGEAGAQWVAAALSQPVGQLDKLALLAALAHRFQYDLFGAAAKGSGWTAAHHLTFAGIRADPGAAAQRAAALLGLDLPAIPAGSGALRYHAKQPDSAFSWDAQDEADAAIEAEHGARIDRACRWMEEALPPPVFDAWSAA